MRRLQAALIDGLACNCLRFNDHQLVVSVVLQQGRPQRLYGHLARCVLLLKRGRAHQGSPCLLRVSRNQVLIIAAELGHRLLNEGQPPRVATRLLSGVRFVAACKSKSIIHVHDLLHTFVVQMGLKDTRLGEVLVDKDAFNRLAIIGERCSCTEKPVIFDGSSFNVLGGPDAILAPKIREL